LRITRILESLYIGSFDDISCLIDAGITHIVGFNLQKDLQDKFETLSLVNSVNCFSILPSVMDFLRKTVLYRGRLLIVEPSNNVMKEVVVIILSHLFKTNTYETYNLIKSQNLFWQLSVERIAKISEWT
jgi:hypothetical protein